MGVRLEGEEGMNLCTCLWLSWFSCSFLFKEGDNIIIIIIIIIWGVKYEREALVLLRHHHHHHHFMP